MSRWDTGLLVLADDLSGAAEAAITIGPPQHVLLHGGTDEDRAQPVDPTLPSDRAPHADLAHSADQAHPADLTVDLDCRYRPAAEAAARTRIALTSFAGPQPARTVLVKIDSLLRGNVCAHLEALLDATQSPILVAPALPQQNRTVVDGAPLVDGVPLRDTPAWAIEEGDAPAHLADLCPVTPAHLSLEAVRADAAPDLPSDGRLVLADAQSMDDLRRIVRLAVQWGAALVGSAALARAWAEVRAGAQAAAHPDELGRAEPDALGSVSTPPTVNPRDSDRSAPHTPTLLVLGTAARRIDGQVAHLLAHSDVDLIDVPAAEVQHWHSDADGYASVLHRVQRALRRGDVVLRLTDTGVAVDPRRLPEKLAALVDAALPHDRESHLVATGGETARAVLDRLQVRGLESRAEIHPGAVLSRALTTVAAGEPAGSGDQRRPRLRFVVTRPGGQGDDNSLALIHRTLAASGISPSKENA